MSEPLPATADPSTDLQAEEVEAFLTGQPGCKPPELTTADRTRVLEGVLACAGRMMPATADARERARTGPSPEPAPEVRPGPSRKPRTRTTFEPVVREILERAVNAGDRQVARDCRVILKGGSTQTAVLAFIERNAPKGNETGE